jgi:hypothetical protein
MDNANSITEKERTILEKISKNLLTGIEKDIIKTTNKPPQLPTYTEKEYLEWVERKRQNTFLDLVVYNFMGVKLDDRDTLIKYKDILRTEKTMKHHFNISLMLKSLTDLEAIKEKQNDNFVNKLIYECIDEIILLKKLNISLGMCEDVFNFKLPPENFENLASEESLNIIEEMKEKGILNKRGKYIMPNKRKNK